MLIIGLMCLANNNVILKSYILTGILPRFALSFFVLPRITIFCNSFNNNNYNIYTMLHLW